MIIICDDCGDAMGFAKTIRYPCDECAQEFVDKHRATGHHVRIRMEISSDRYAFI